jgi:hypothetical protein
MLTWPQILDETKDVTRRLGFDFARPGMLLLGVQKARGVRVEDRGQTKVIEVVSVRPEEIGDITPDEVRREGFPKMSPIQFIDFFLAHMKRDREGLRTTPYTWVNRIEFKYVK